MNAPQVATFQLDEKPNLEIKNEFKMFIIIFQDVCSDDKRTLVKSSSNDSIDSNQPPSFENIDNFRRTPTHFSRRFTTDGAIDVFNGAEGSHHRTRKISTPTRFPQSQQQDSSTAIKRKVPSIINP